MAVYRRSNRGRYILFLLVLTSVTLLTLDERAGHTGAIDRVRGSVRDAVAPLQAGLASAVAPVGRFFSTVTHYRDLKSENERLRRSLEDARARGLRSADAERERQSLLELARLSFAESIPTVAARVVSTAPSNFQVTVEIDHGTTSGVEKGMPVATAAGLVGRVVETAKRQATVMLLTDPAFNVGIRLSDSGDVGVARGSGARQPLSADFIDVGTRVSAGEVTVTSGLEQSVFPPGIPVARVRSARVDPGVLQQEIRLDPVVDIRHVEFLRVLKWSTDDELAKTVR